jgi:23S rRNA (adenine2503-C2)-methyltransferase
MNSESRPPADILDLTFPALRAQLAIWQEPPFRARQLWKWLYVHLATDFEQMSNLDRGAVLG